MTEYKRKNESVRGKEQEKNIVLNWEKREGLHVWESESGREAKTDRQRETLSKVSFGGKEREINIEKERRVRVGREQERWWGEVYVAISRGRRRRSLSRRDTKGRKNSPSSRSRSRRCPKKHKTPASACRRSRALGLYTPAWVWRRHGRQSSQAVSFVFTACVLSLGKFGSKDVLKPGWINFKRKIAKFNI